MSFRSVHPLALSPLLLACSGNGSAPGMVEAGTRPDATHALDAARHDGAATDSSSQQHDSATDAGPSKPSVLQFHGDGTRAGLYVDRAFTKAAIGGLEPLPGFGFAFPGGAESVFTQVLYAAGAVKGADALVVATELDNVYALNPDTGAVLWKTHVGTPATAAAFPAGCGSIYPLGITGTPVIDAASGILYFVAATLTGGTHPSSHFVGAHRAEGIGGVT